MKKIFFSLISAILITVSPCFAQKNADNSRIDIMLVLGDNNKVIDTCQQILTIDSLNPEIYYKMGLAYQNLLSEEKSFDCFLKAATISPDNNRYNFRLAQSFYNKGKLNQAEPLLSKLCAIDSLNWTYSYYLTSIYMQDEKYDESLKIYTRFHRNDTNNYIFLDKMGFASLKNKDLSYAIDLYNKSLAINNKNVNAIKNLAYLYSSTYRVDTAIQLLTKGIETDPTDMDLYARRATIYYLIKNNKKALNDYLTILSSGDSTILYLKRAGIGYTNNLQPKEGIMYLLLAYKKDSSDYETASYLGQNYYKLNDPRNSIYYYKRVIRILSPITNQEKIANIMLAEAQKKGGFYKEAIATYLNALKLSTDINLYMIIANLYDEKLNDLPKAIYYYERFFESLKNEKMNFKSDYVESIKKRIDFLKEKQAPATK